MSSERCATPPAIVPCTVPKIPSFTSSIRSHSKSVDCGVYDIWTLGAAAAISVSGDMTPQGRFAAKRDPGAPLPTNKRPRARLCGHTR